MTLTEFNLKWKDYIEKGFYGLDINNEDVINFLDEEFEQYKDDGFNFAQIKLKFGYPRVYTSLPNDVNEYLTESIKKILN